ncbi:MAG: hypothetical protein ACTHOE_14200 [Conexibacter sp.]
MTPDSDTQSWLAPGVERVLVALPAAVAVGLALLYSLGALLSAAELRNEGVELTVGLRLIPLEQLLARGIGSAMVIAAGVGLIAWLLPLLWRLDRHVAANEQRRREREVGASTADQRAVVWMLAVLCGVLATLSLLFAPLFVAVVSAFFLGRLAWSFRVADRPPRALPTAAAMFVFAAAACIGQAFANPRPLPSVTLTRAGGGTVRGKLVGVSSAGWYLTSRPKTVIAVPADQVALGRVELQPHGVWTLLRFIESVV